ncbi:MAG: ECF transporter S component [Clostridia bacterium]|nr:ECF transporter S component [Clostridia bacterium]
MKTNNIRITTYNAMFIVISLILGFLGRMSIFAMVPFLKLDFSDIPAFLATLLFGFSSGAIVLIVSSLIRSMMFSSVGWISFVVKLTMLLMLFFISKANEINKRTYKIILVGSVLYLTIKLFLNCLVWKYFFGMTTEFLKTIIFPLAIPYNCTRLLINIVVSNILFKYMKNNHINTL